MCSCPSTSPWKLETIKKAVTDDTKIIYICNPHSPSGTLYSRESILDLAEFCQKKGIIVSVDENYIEFAHKGEEATVAGYVKKYENLFVIRSVTKFYGMPGIRFGYAIAAESLIDKLQTVRHALEHQRLSRMRHAGGLQRHRIHRKHQTNHHTRKSRVRQKAHRNRRVARFPLRNEFSARQNHLAQNYLNRSCGRSWAKKGCLSATAAPSWA